MRVTEQGLGDAETLAHAAGETGDGLVGVLRQIGLFEQAGDDGLALLSVGDALEDGEMVQHRPSRHARIDAEVLGQITQCGAQGLGVLENVDLAEGQAALIRRLQGRNGAHQGRFTGAIGAKQTEHSLGDRQIHPVQRTNLIAVSFRQSLDFQHLFLRH